MIIKLPTADFSANNIGSVDLRTEVSPTTQALLDLYGKTWTLPQQFAIEDFLVGVQAASYYSKISKLLLPILAPTATINLTLTNTNNIAFYDIKNASYVPIRANGGGSTYHKIGANGLFADTNANGNLYGLQLKTILTGFDKTNVHSGIYYDSNNLTSQIAGNLNNISNNTDVIQLGFSTGGASATYDTNTRLPRGLKIASFTPTSTTGLSNALPLASATVNANSNADFTSTDYNLLSKAGTSELIKLGTNISLVTLGQALTQPETVAYNQLIDNLMNSLWTV